MKTEFRILITFLFVSLLYGCKGNNSKLDVVPDSLLTLKYAKGFNIEYYKDYKKVVVNNPWKKGDIFATYYLVKNIKVNTPSDGIKIKIPLNRYCATSATQYEFLKILGIIDKLKGVCSPELIYDNQLISRFKNRKIKNLGDPYNINVESVLATNPDAVFVSGFNQESSIIKRLKELGLNVVYDNEWMETSILARAEWIKFIAVFFDKEDVANSFFYSVDKNYNTMKQKVKGIKNRPSVLCGGNFKGIWYMSGGHSYMAGLLADAGADYYYKNDTTTGSIPLNFETVLKNFETADFWIGCSADSYKELISMDERHSLFKAERNKCVYNFNARKTKKGGNDFWESGVARPDFILCDLIKVFHPDLMKNYKFVYTSALK